MKLPYISLLFAFWTSTSIYGQNQQVRRVILLAREANDSNLLKQKDLFLGDPGGLAERDITVKVITRKADPEEYMRQKPNSSFTFILYGKDGLEKFRSSGAVTPQSLYAIIDAMPMRKEEMKKRQDQ
jgi:Domain of unknown function (DUF4174)